MRLAVYCDYGYRREGGVLYAEEAFSVFLAGLRPHLEALVLVGRLDPRPGRWHHRLPADVGFAPLPHYGRLSHLPATARALARSLRRFGVVLRDVDGVWLMGPHPLSVAFALLAAMHGKRVVLGVRQDFPTYIRRRHPGRRSLHALALLLEAAYRLLARGSAVVVVGPELAHHYRRARHLLSTPVSLVREQDLASASVEAPRSRQDELQVLSVGRLDPEKNPLLLADVLARLNRGGLRWRMVVCGEGVMAGPLARRLAELGVADRAELRGYLTPEGGLRQLYRDSHAFLHVSFTEGVPQVLLEAFAARLPVVATAVGGVEEAARGAALLVEPGDAEAAAAALERLAGDPCLRDRMTATGAALAGDLTMEAQCRRVATFLSEPGEARQRPPIAHRSP